MTFTPHRKRVLRLLALIGVFSLLFTLVPPPTVEAVRIDRLLDTTIDDFTQGSFLRTALVDPGELGEPIDASLPVDGTVQLALFGRLTPLNVANFQLPARLRDYGLATIGSRFYVMGGEKFGDGQLGTTEEVWSGQVDLEIDEDGLVPTGLDLTAEGWRDELPLPGVQHIDINQTGYDDVISGTHSMATAAIDNDEGNDYIYVIGGLATEPAGFSRSSFSVRIARVNGITGAISGWINSDDHTGMRIPGPDANDPEFRQWGLHSATAMTANINDTNYVYFFGGYELVSGQSGIARPTRRAYYARVGSDGRPYKPGTTDDTDENLGWGQLDDIPITEEDQGLYDASAVFATATVVTETTSLFLIGGFRAENVWNALVYQAILQGDGSLEWTDWEGTLPTGLRGHDSVEYRGNVYVTGGYKAGDPNPTTDALLSYIEENAQLHVFSAEAGGDGSNFQGPADTDPPIPAPRADHRSALIDGLGTGILYVMGGLGVSQGDTPASERVYVLRLSRDNLVDPEHFTTGTYRSRLHGIELGDPEIEEISWTAEIPRSDSNLLDIEMEYRTSETNCANPTWTEWFPLQIDPENNIFSNDGRNVLEVDTGITRCFQYQGTFRTNNPQVSPNLGEVAIRIFSPNSPDVRVYEDNFAFDEGSETLTAEIINEYAPNPPITLPADVENPGEGEFVVDLYIVGEGYNEQIITPTLPLSSTFYVSDTGTLSSTLFTMVERPGFDPGTRIALTDWCDSANPEDCDIVFEELFTVTGEYAICIGVDSYVAPADYDANPERLANGLVNETLPGAEDNNFSCTEFFITREPPTTTLQLAQTSIITEGVTRDAFTVSRPRATSQPLTVTFQMDGTAVISEDYTLFIVNSEGMTERITDTVVIPPGETQVQIFLEALDNEVIEEDKELTLRLSPDPSGEDPPRYVLSGETTEVEASMTILNDDEEPPPDNVYLPIIRRT